jgi:hypothetical protein
MRKAGQNMPKTSSSKTTQVHGGSIKREVRSGRFVEVHTSSGRSKASSKSASALTHASSKRGEALKRLADR